MQHRTNPALSFLMSLAMWSGGPAYSAPGDTVTTTEGVVTGALDGNALSWKGIPYALAPTGQLRWKAPRPPQLRSSPLSTTSFGPKCPQMGKTNSNNSADVVGDEDCLHLNIWRPQSAATNLPVMVWLHGGGYGSGASDDPNYNGATLAAQNNVVVVTLNYRLGMLGFLAHSAFLGEDALYPSAGNYGILDQIQALKWIKSSITAFGGASDNITLFGHSVGGWSECVLLATPLAGTGDLFQRVIMQSPVCSTFKLPAATQPRNGFPPATQRGANTASKLGCTSGSPSSIAACMRGKHFRDIVASGVKLYPDPQPPGALFPFWPSIDGHVLIEDLRDSFAANRTKAVPMIVGSNSDEAAALSWIFYGGLTEAQYKAWINGLVPDATQAAQVLSMYPVTSTRNAGQRFTEVLADLEFACNVRYLARRNASRGQPTYSYLFAKADWLLGAYHGAELQYVFGTLPVGTVIWDAWLSEKMRQHWRGFASNANPAYNAGNPWPLYAASVDQIMKFDVGSSLISNHRKAQCDLWDSIGAVSLPTSAFDP